MNSVIRTYIRESRRELEDEFTTSAIEVYRWYSGQPMPLLVARHISHALGVPMGDFDTPIWQMICGKRPSSQATLDKIQAIRARWRPNHRPYQSELAEEYSYSVPLVNWICGGEKEKEDG